MNLPAKHEGEYIDLPSKGIARLFICEGNEKDFEQIFQVDTYIEHMHLRRGWELKDVFTMPMPGNIKYMELRDYKAKMKNGVVYVIAFCRY